MSIVCNNSSFSELQGLVNKVETPLSKEPSYYHLVRAEALRIKKFFWDSIEEYLTAIELDNENIEAFKGLGLAYKQIGCIKSAISSFSSAKKLNYFDSYLYFEAGCCYCMEQNYPDAIKEYKQALNLCPDYLEARFNLALAYEMSEQYGLAIEEYSALIKMNPEFIKAYNNLGSLYMKFSDYKSSLKVFRDVLKHNPGFTRAYLGVAISSDKLGQRIIASRYYKKYLKKSPNSDNVPYIIDRLGELSRERAVLSGKPHIMLVS